MCTASSLFQLSTSPIKKKPMTMRFVLSSVVAAFVLVDISHALLANPSAKRATGRLIPDLTFVRPDTSGMEEAALRETAALMQRVKVPASESVHPDGEVGISYVNWPAQGG
jgi:hypothetical protein